MPLCSDIRLKSEPGYSNDPPSSRDITLPVLFVVACVNNSRCASILPEFDRRENLSF